MKHSITPEEHARVQRRRGRQALGLLVAILVVVGFVTVLRAGVGAVANLFDDTAQKQEYEDKLEGLVLFDPMPFDGIENIDDLTLREAASIIFRKRRAALTTTIPTPTPNSCCCPRWMWTLTLQSCWARASS